MLAGRDASAIGFKYKVFEMLFAAVPLDVQEVLNLPVMTPSIFLGYAPRAIRA